MTPEETTPAAAPASLPSSPPPPAVPPPAATPQQQANIAELLALAKNFLATQQQAAPTSPATEPGEPESRPRQRFQRYNPEAAAATTAVAATENSSGSGDDVAETSGAASVPAPGGRVDPSGALRGSKRRQRALPPSSVATALPRRAAPASRLTGWLVGLALLGGLTLGWFLQPRLSRALPPAEAAPSPALEQNPIAAAATLPALPPDSMAARATAPDAKVLRALALVDEALAAERAHELAKAARSYEDAYNLDPRVPAAARRLAELATAHGDLQAAILWNTRAFASGDNLAATLAQRGVIASRTGNLRAALASFTAATRADPQTARWYFYLAQALRRSGNLQEALVRMRQASERAEEPQQAEFFQFIVRLTQIELGQVNELLTETAAKLQSPAPPADWVLTAAAIDLQRGQPEQAAKLLSQVFQQQPASYAAARLDDVFFRNYATVREMAPLYAKYLPEGAGVVPADAARTVKPPAVSLLPPGATSPGPLLNPLPTPPPAPSNSPAAEPAAQEGAPNNAR